MTYAEHLLAEGEARGEAKGEQRTKARIVCGLLQTGVTWEVIEAGFETLKAKLASFDAAS